MVHQPMILQSELYSVPSVMWPSLIQHLDYPAWEINYILGGNHVEFASSAIEMSVITSPDSQER